MGEKKKNLRGIESHVLFLSLKFSRKLPVEKKMVYVYCSAPMLLPLMRGTFFLSFEIYVFFFSHFYLIKLVEKFYFFLSFYLFQFNQYNKSIFLFFFSTHFFYSLSIFPKGKGKSYDNLNTTYQFFKGIKMY